MRILIINTNREQKPQTLFPIGACCIAAAACAAGYDTQFLDLTFTRKPLREVKTAIQQFHPDVIGLSIRNLDNCDAVTPYNYLPEMRAIVDTCRQFSSAILILGGAAVSLAPVPILRYLGGDYAVVGEGERVFVLLLRALEQHTDPSCISGVVSAQQIREETPSVATLEQELPSLPDVDYSRWLPLLQYQSYDAAYPIQTKRGCCFHCSYCRYPYLEGRRWRLRDPDWVGDEVARAASSGLRLVEFVDSVFGLPGAHAIACCEAISRQSFTGALCTMELNPTACVPELMQAMNAARFTSVAITAESGSDAMLAQMQKGFTSRELHQAAEALRNLHTQKMWIFMVGAHGESAETVQETARFIATLPATDFVYVTFGVRILPGTALQQTLVASGELSAEEGLLQPSFYHSPHIDPERAKAMLASSGFPSLRFITLHDSSHCLLPIVQRLIAQTGLRPPYWRHIPWLNRLRRLLHV
ncbi:MAG: B12-binding domain-containing radical SAM protein [Armatimonadota bacterium]